MRAQKEIDAFLSAPGNSNRLPTFKDRESLPYVNALVLEVMRWHNVVPTGVPHRVTDDNIHDGWIIEKDSLIIPNIW